MVVNQQMFELFQYIEDKMLMFYSIWNKKYFRFY